MRISSLKSRAMLAVGAAMSLIAACGPASAFTASPETLPAVQADQSTIAVYREGVDTPKVEHVWCRWGRCGWGWGPGAVIGGLAAGALVGGALAAPYYGGGPYYPYGGCMRRVWGYYGWQWVRVC